MKKYIKIVSENRMKLLMAVLLIALGIAGRMFVHPWNFTPIVAISLFAGVYFDRRLALVVPIVSMFISDLFIGFYNLPIMISVYVSFAVAGFVGTYFAKARNIGRVTGASLISSIMFFLVTNASVWMFGTMYTKNIGGLLQSYVAGIPFFGNMIVGDLFYTFVLFGIYEAVLFVNKNLVSKKDMVFVKVLNK